MRKAQKVECLRFALTPFGPAVGCKTTKFNQPGFVRVQLQTEVQKALAQFVEKPLCFRSVLEAHHEVVSKANDDNISASLLLAPLVNPKVQYVKRDGKEGRSCFFAFLG